MDEYGSGGDTSPLLKGFSSSSSAPSQKRNYGGFVSKGDNEIRTLEVKFLLLTAALLVLMALVLTGGIIYIVALLTNYGQYDPVTPANYKVDILTEYYMVNVDNGAANISIVVCRPKPTSNFLSSVYPVILEVCGTRKDDMEYIELLTRQAYFVRRGYVHVTMDVRGTGSSSGDPPNKEHDVTEVSDVIQVMGYLITNFGWVNGYIGLYGREWSAETALAVAMTTSNNTSLKHLSAIYAMHGASDYYYSGVPYMDGLLHYDQYVLRMDHLHALPPLNEVFNESLLLAPPTMQRLLHTPWTYTYLDNQLTGGSFWGNYTPLLPNISVPAYSVGGLFNNIRDSAVDVCQAMGVSGKKFCKLVMGPWNSSFAYNSRLSPTYDDLSEAVRWFDNYLKRNINNLVDEAPMQLYIRDSDPDPSTLEKNISGHWFSNDTVNTVPLRLYLCPNSSLSASENCTFVTLDGGTWEDEFSSVNVEDVSLWEAVSGLNYNPQIGEEMGRWWGEVKGNQSSLDASSLFFTAPPFQEPFVLVGQPVVNFLFEADTSLVKWMIRLEEVFPDGTVTHVTGRAVSANQLLFGSSDYVSLVPGQTYSLSVTLRFTTYTFSVGGRIRLAITNVLFPMFWPTPNATMGNLLVPGPSLDLPQLTNSTVQSLPNDFFTTLQFNESMDGPDLSDAKRYEAGGWPRNEWAAKQGDDVAVTWMADMYMTVQQNFIASYLGYTFTQSPSSSFTSYTAYAVSVYILNMSISLPPDSSTPNCSSPLRPLTDSVMYLEHVLDPFQFPDPPNPLVLACSDIPNVDLDVYNWYQVTSNMTLSSDENYFYLSFQRYFAVNSGDSLKMVYNISNVYPRVGQ